MILEIRLGDKVKCKYTGFTGIVMAKTEFLNGCVQFTVSEKYDKKKANSEMMPIIEMPVDEQSLVLVDKKLRKPTKEEVMMARETMDELEDDEEESTGGPSKIISRVNSASIIRRRRNRC